MVENDEQMSGCSALECLHLYGRLSAPRYMVDSPMVSSHAADHRPDAEYRTEFTKMWMLKAVGIGLVEARTHVRTQGAWCLLGGHRYGSFYCGVHNGLERTGVNPLNTAIGQSLTDDGVKDVLSKRLRRLW
mmetsp:Transcript_9606/g.29094  ORF Transcript_9606/g.29094 Transcript_9606/m.29094 type:complete len:131 (+) Transcript_9606:1641-2033(+)